MHRLNFVIAAALIVIAGMPTTAQQPAASGVSAAPKTAARAVTNVNATGGRLLPGTKGSLFTTIQGNALNSTNGALPNTQVRLRDARFGRVADAQLTDRSGMFAFRTVDPGSYIVEVMGNDHTVLAASQIINVNTGDAVTAVVKLPFRIPPFAGILGQTAPSATAVTTEAAASGVLAATVSGQPASSRPIS